MNLLDLFKSKEERAKLSHLKRLIALSAADGVVKDSEIVAIASVVEREGLSQKDFERIVKNPKSVALVRPKDDITKLKYLSDMVLLMMCDGEMDEKEYLVCKMAALELGYKHEVIDALIATIIVEIKNKFNL